MFIVEHAARMHNAANPTLRAGFRTYVARYARGRRGHPGAGGGYAGGRRGPSGAPASRQPAAVLPLMGRELPALVHPTANMPLVFRRPRAVRRFTRISGRFAAHGPRAPRARASNGKFAVGLPPPPRRAPLHANQRQICRSWAPGSPRSCIQRQICRWSSAALAPRAASRESAADLPLMGPGLPALVHPTANLPLVFRRPRAVRRFTRISGRFAAHGPRAPRARASYGKFAVGLPPPPRHSATSLRLAIPGLPPTSKWRPGGDTRWPLPPPLHHRPPRPEMKAAGGLHFASPLFAHE